jgi:hypothetical protein
MRIKVLVWLALVSPWFVIAQSQEKLSKEQIRQEALNDLEYRKTRNLKRAKCLKRNCMSK